jgi:sugar-specific transcriptional regulator TrmB
VANVPVVEQLQRLGLTSYEARTYVGLTGRHSLTAAQAARLSGVPRQRIYDILGSLVEKGMASARPGSVIKYAATEPSLAIERLVDLRRQEFAEIEYGAAAIMQGLTAAYTAGRKHTDPLEYIEVLRDPGAVNARFDQLQAGIKREILIFTKPPYAKPPQENVEGLRVVRTHEARSVYEISVLDDPEVRAGVRRFIEAGEQARFVDQLPLKLVIIDETIVMFGMQAPVATGDLTMMVVEHPSLATLLKMAFNAYWDKGLTIDQAAERLAVAATRTA